MALINLNTVPNRAWEILIRSNPSRGLEFLTYKRNRGVGIIRLKDDLFLVK